MYGAAFVFGAFFCSIFRVRLFFVSQNFCLLCTNSATSQFFHVLSDFYFHCRHCRRSIFAALLLLGYQNVNKLYGTAVHYHFNPSQHHYTYTLYTTQSIFSFSLFFCLLPYWILFGILFLAFASDFLNFFYFFFFLLFVIILFA